MTEIEKTISLEGGATYTEDPADPGGGTRFGISKMANPDVDVKNLTLEEAVQIYKVRYWNPLHLDQYQLKQFRWKVFDIAVNQGVATASAFMQNLEAKKDTMDAVYELGQMQMRRYAKLVAQHPEFYKFIVGWTNRAFDYGDNLD